MGLGTRPVGVAEVNRGIEFGVGKQEWPSAVGQVDGHFRVLELEILEPWQQPLRAEGRDDCELDDVGALLAHYREGVALHRIELSRHPTTVGKTRLGQFHSTSRASEQFHAEEVFQAGDLSANGTLCERQFFSSTGKALMAGGSFETDQGGGAGDLPAHVRQPH